MTVRATILLEVEASEHFEEENINWQFCMQHANFVHKEACEFIIHVGPDGRDSDYFKDLVPKMKEFGCTSAFVQEYEYAAEIGAERVLFYV